MKFREYEEIEGVWNEKTVSYFREQGCFDPKILWVVTEKIDGSNFAFYYDGKETKYAKRGSFIDNLSSFFRSDTMVANYEPKIIQLYNYLRVLGVVENEMIVYGELFGGAFPNFKSTVKRINKGVYYAPNLEYYVFDILADRKYLSVVELIEACYHAQLFCVEILKAGNFDEVKGYPNNFISTVSKRLGFEEVLNDNVTEGLVIRPNESFNINDTRVILKSKNEKFLTKSRAKTNPKEKKEKREKEIAEYLIPVLDELLLYINENRLRTVLSKIGFFSKTDFGKILELFREDVWKDYEKEHEVKLSDDDRKLINSLLGKECVEIWRPIFLKEAI